MTTTSISQRLDEAATKAENASQILHDVAHGDAMSSVVTGSGLVPTIAKWFAEKDDQVSGEIGVLRSEFVSHELAGNPHPQYLRSAQHGSTGNPHTQYIQSANHNSTGDPHTQYLKRVAGVVTAMGLSYIDAGTVAASGTAQINVQQASIHRVQAAGNLTIEISGWAADGRSEDVELHCVNFGGKTVVWPAGNWIRQDGSYVAAASNSGVIWQSSGVDRVLVMRDGGQLHYKVMR